MVNKAWILTGATATGKSAVCQLLAKQLGLSILSADSMLVYKGMDIGTAKPTAEERGCVPCYGMDLVTPDQPFSTGAWLQAARNALEHSALTDKKDNPLIITGGTGLYIKAVTSGIEAEAVSPERRDFWKSFLAENGLSSLQSELRKRLGNRESKLPDSPNPRRIIRALEQLDTTGKLPDNWSLQAHQPPIMTLTMPREQLRARIHHRVKQMFAEGLLDEVRELKQLYPQWSPTASKAIGYEEAQAVLQGTQTQDEAMERITIRTRQLAKRQETWFRHQQRTIWCEIDSSDCVENVAKKVLCLWNEYGTIELKI